MQQQQKQHTEQRQIIQSLQQLQQAQAPPPQQQQQQAQQQRITAAQTPVSNPGSTPKLAPQASPARKSYKRTLPEEHGEQATQVQQAQRPPQVGQNNPAPPPTGLAQQATIRQKLVEWSHLEKQAAQKRPIVQLSLEDRGKLGMILKQMVEFMAKWVQICSVLLQAGTDEKAVKELIHFVSYSLSRLSTDGE